jgi:hypothetical protein
VMKMHNYFPAVPNLYPEENLFVCPMSRREIQDDFFTLDHFVSKLKVAKVI